MIELYTAATPNGWKASIMLEEIGKEYTLKPINLSQGQQKADDFLAMNPNGRIPVIKDTETGQVVFESGAILIYLAEKYGVLYPQEDKYEILQWLMFQMGGVGPMMGQANVFFRYFPEKITAVIDRYQNEVKRLFSVLDARLKGQDYLVGAYSIADIANWSWVHTAYWSGVELAEFKHLNKWVDRIAQRDAVQKGINTPPKPDEEAIKKAGQKIIK
jgi:glutathione S-transferase